MKRIKRLLTPPLMRDVDIDDPHAMVLRRQIIHEKAFLRLIYEEWYQRIASMLPVMNGQVLEIGTGPGFLEKYIPGLITSDVFPCPGIHLTANAHHLPFPDQSLRGIVMTDVLHHISRPREFFAQATRCMRPGGVIAMIEPWANPWASLIYTRLHHEPFLPAASDWELPEGGLMSVANGAMPWIIFKRDRSIFEKEFPEWEIRTITPFMPLRYLLSGGMSMRSLMPAWTFPMWRAVEKPLDRHAGMFAQILLVRR